MRIIHCADLHLSAAERDYGLAVLDEIVAVAAEADALILAGDVFDSWSDMEALRAEFRRRIGSLPPGCTPVLIGGNHERLGAAGALASMDLGCRVHDERPFGMVRLPDLEILTIPYTADTTDYLRWEVPPSTAPRRIAVAHGSVAGAGFVGPDEESEAAAIDPDLFSRLQVDYAAMGHIHSGRIETLGRTVVAYPGSARVWRRGEEGPRRVIVLEAGADLRYETRPLAAAGQYRRFTIPLGLDGTCPDLSDGAARWGAADWIDIELSGLVENEHAAAEQEGLLRERHGGAVRRFDVRRDEILVLEGVATQPVARRFLELWQGHRPDGAGPPREVWLRARELGLRKIKGALESR